MIVRGLGALTPLPEGVNVTRADTRWWRRSSARPLRVRRTRTNLVPLIEQRESATVVLPARRRRRPAQVRCVAQRTAIATFLEGPGDLDDVLARTVRALTQLTGQVAIVQYPSFARANVTHVELVQLGGGRMLVIVVTDTGRVSQRMAFVRDDFDEADLARIRAELGTLLVGRSVRDGLTRMAERLGNAATMTAPHEAATAEIVRVVAEELEEFRQDRLVMAGSATLARREADFRGSIYPLLEAIEEQVTILRLMGEMVADEKGLAASIGRENEPFGLSEASVVASDYDATGSRARVGIMGPTRMDYPTNLAAVRTVARYLTRMLEEDESSR